MPRGEVHASTAERALEEDALQSVEDAIKHAQRADAGSYEQALAYVTRASESLGEAKRALRLAYDAAAVEEKDE
jgi:hypothetical protein